MISFPLRDLRITAFFLGWQSTGSMYSQMDAPDGVSLQTEGWYTMARVGWLKQLRMWERWKVAQ